jgi:hypothetical protein
MPRVVARGSFITGHYADSVDVLDGMPVIIGHSCFGRLQSAEVRTPPSQNGVAWAVFRQLEALHDIPRLIKD